ncbi:MAG: hypothetical protein ACRC8S_11225 [Fimbriiglobus sp.]
MFRNFRLLLVLTLSLWLGVLPWSAGSETRTVITETVPVEEPNVVEGTLTQRISKPTFDQTQRWQVPPERAILAARVMDLSTVLPISSSRRQAALCVWRE